MRIIENQDRLRVSPTLPYNQEPTSLPNNTVYNYVMLLNIGQDTQDLDACIKRAADQIFKRYPIWDEAERQHLNEAILDEFLFRGIAYETYGQWKFCLNHCLDEIMPRYNDIVHQYKLFNDKNILGLENDETFGEVYKRGLEKSGTNNTDTNVTDNEQQTSNTTFGQTGEDHQTGQGTDTTKVTDKDVLNRQDVNKYWDTPQTDLQASDKSYATDIRNIQTNQTDNKDSNSSSQSTNKVDSNSRTDSNTDNTSNRSSTQVTDMDNQHRDVEDENHELNQNRHRYGNDGHSTAQLIKEYRELVISIIEEILKDPRLNKQFCYVLDM